MSPCNEPFLSAGMAWAQEDQRSVRANAVSAGPEPEPEPALDPGAGLGPRLGWYAPEPGPEPEPDGAVEAEPPTLSLCLGSWCPGALLPSKLVDAALKRCACVRSGASGLPAGVSPRSPHAGAVLPPVRPHCVVHCCTTCREVLTCCACSLPVTRATVGSGPRSRSPFWTLSSLSSDRSGRCAALVGLPSRPPRPLSQPPRAGRSRARSCETRRVGPGRWRSTASRWRSGSVAALRPRACAGMCAA